MALISCKWNVGEQFGLYIAGRWLEYVDKTTKMLNLYDSTAEGTQETIYTFDKSFEFVSHVRKCRKDVIIVKNHKKVQVERL